MTARTDLRTKRRRAKRQREWEAARPFILDPVSGERFRYQPPRLVWVDLPGPERKHWPAHYSEGYLP